MRCSLQSEHGHTLYCAESARMYTLHVKNQDIRTTEWPESTVVTHPVDHPLQIHQPALHHYIRDCVLFNVASLTKGLHEVTN
jgi:hypothetical protein